MKGQRMVQGSKVLGSGLKGLEVPGLAVKL